MSKKKASPDRRQDRHAQPRLAFHLPQPLFDAFNRYVDGLEPRPNESEVLRLALTRYLTGVGFWPPPSSD